MHWKHTLAASLVLLLALGGGGSLLATLLASQMKPREPVYALSMPEHPFLIYLAPPGSTRGLITDAYVLDKGAVIVRSWAEARREAAGQPLDVLFVDNVFIENSLPFDRDWLRHQFENGVIIVGLGVDDDVLGPMIGTSLRQPNEANPSTDPVDAILAYELILARPDDLQKMRAAGDIGLGNPVPGIMHPASFSSGMARARLDTEREVRVLFLNMSSFLAGIYQQRAEFAASLSPLSDIGRALESACPGCPIPQPTPTP